MLRVGWIPHLQLGFHGDVSLIDGFSALRSRGSAWFGSLARSSRWGSARLEHLGAAPLVVTCFVAARLGSA
ncbi:hypothetical protein DVH24_010083 [Malus domestica]|uniref:Uncharacterized protein n=1 Tax=Malus domestica TaxID=3750 RepID=A0A498JPQ9_MALDO|nr:hypothetical protein DVH24_010083 [Malus domestica]